jgi:CheY-like chemotaxis protein
MVASDILKESGFQTFHAYDAETAARVLNEHPEIEVVVTDSDLSGEVTGLDLCRRVSQERPNVQLVVTDSTRDLRASDVPEGARVLRKPYASGDLKTLVAARSLLADA